MQANKNSKYQIKDNEKGFYHMRFVAEMATPDGSHGPQVERFQCFTPRDFKEFLKHKKHFNFVSEEIIHDPTLETQPEVVAQPTESEPPKKIPYFASEEFKQKRQQKLNQKKQ